MSAEPNPINKTLIKQRGQELAESIRYELRVSPEDQQKEQKPLGTMIIQKADSDPAALSHFERGLLKQYVLLWMSNASQADHWLDQLPALESEYANAFQRRSTYAGLFVLLAKLLGPLAKWLPPPEVSLQYADWHRSNRRLIVCGGLAIIFVIVGADALAWAFIYTPTAPNWGPPAAFVALGLLAWLLAVLSASASRSIKPSILSAIILANTVAFQLIVYLLFQMSASLVLITLVMLSSVFSLQACMYKWRQKNEIQLR